MIAGLPFDIWLKVAVLSLPRLTVMFFVIPIFGKGNMPAWLRATILLSLGLILAPLLQPSVSSIPFDNLYLVLLLVKEALLGLLLAFPLAVAYWAVQGIGYYIDNQRGAAIADTIDPLTSEQSSSLGILFGQAFIVYFFIVGGFNELLSFAYGSYLIWPVENMLPSFSESTSSFYIDTFSNMLTLIVILSAPVILLMFVTELSLALISKFAPTLNVFFLAMPVKSAVALFVLVLYVPLLFKNLTESNFLSMSEFPEIQELFEATPADPTTTLEPTIHGR
jgi:type III secretion protein T